MAYRYGNRHQMTLLPQSIEEYVAADDPVRAYDAFVESLDFNALGIDINPHQVGNAQYDPRASGRGRNIRRTPEYMGWRTLAYKPVEITSCFSSTSTMREA